MRFAGAITAIIATALCTGAARAADRPSIGLTLNASIGTHEEASGRQRVPLVPVPMLDLRIPIKRFEIEVQGVPPIGPVGYDSGISLVSRTTKFSYLLGMLRYHIPHSRFSVGIGETLYNQETVYRQTLPVPCLLCPGTQMFTITEYNRSRVAGARYEIGYSVPVSKIQSLAFTAAVTPAMHATIREELVFDDPLNPPPSRINQSAPETGSQVDGQVYYTVHARAVDWLFGVRYLNYVAHFESNGLLSDRNSLVLPFVGIQVPIGH
jgi:hypothetical protein